MTSAALRVRTLSGAMLLALAASAMFWSSALQAKEPDWNALARGYKADIRPLMVRYCQDCHSGDTTEADVDLGAFPSLAEVRKHPQIWQKVGEMLASGQMPPKDADPQPTAAQRTQLNDWVHGYLTVEAQARAGDPGRVVLRRLSNAEYTYTLRDLTGVDSLDPAREFPVDGAAGEGFTNTGNALVMSPSLVTKYLDAGKEVADHLVLLPSGVRFSPSTSRRDWTNETLVEIREFYRRFTDARGGNKVNLQGIVFDTNEGGRLPVEKYLAATLTDRDQLAAGAKAVAEVAQKHGLNAKYLGILWRSLTDKKPSLLLDGLRARWRTAKPNDAAALTAEIAAWQKGLWNFGTVGHIGKVGGPKAWLEPVSPITSKQDLRLKLPPPGADGAVTVSLVAADIGDGNEHDFAIWQQPRLVAPGQPDILLRDVRQIGDDLAQRRQRVLASAANCLAAAAEAEAAKGQADPVELARKHGVELDVLRGWLGYLGIGTGDTVTLGGYFKNKIGTTAGFAFITGWGSNDTPLLLANSSDQHVRVPGNMKPHGVAVHPSPTLKAAVGWRSPVTAAMRLEAGVTHAHPECGNGVTWSLELRRGATRRQLAAGTCQGGNAGPRSDRSTRSIVRPGDVVSLLIGPRDGNHSCDLTAIELKLTAAGDGGKTWSLADDVSPNVQVGNPHGDRFGNAGVWHFYTELEQGGGPTASPAVPAGSLLAKWQAADNASAREQLAGEVQKMLTAGPPAAKDSPDAVLYQELSAIGGPLLGTAVTAGDKAPVNQVDASKKRPASGTGEWGVDPALFGKHPDGTALDAASLCVRAPSVIEVRLPADLAAGRELFTSGVLDPRTGSDGSVQLQVVAGKAAQQSGLTPSTVKVTDANGQWTSDNRQVAYDVPILVNAGSAAAKRIEAALDEFRKLFPAALCYTKIVPVDEVVTLTLFYREDDNLVRLMLDDAQAAQLNRLWDDLHFESQDALILVDGLAQLIEFATQDADPKVFEPLREPFAKRAAAFRQLQVDSQPKHVAALLDLAALAYRRPLAPAEAQELPALYGKLREQEIPHEEAMRLLLARVLVAPAFLYRVEKPGQGAAQTPVSNWELASRLSYFLWSSMPDAELRDAAAAGRLTDPATLVAQMRRMLHDGRTRRLATEFGCQWLHVRDFDHLDEKSETHFPTFVGLREAMREESVQFFTELFRNNGSVLGILDADYTFLNEDLAKHYGIPGISGAEWRKVEGVKRFARGGILAQATTLASQSGASRTSPILRGNWISETLLGERLPRPPKDVPQLPADEAALAGLTVRQLVEKHTSDAKCAVCHQRIDAMGFALEGFDAIGRRRDKDLGDRPINTRVKTMDGAEFEDIDGLRGYLLTVRREAFLRQFCRKLLGYSLGRAVQLSDEPLLADLQTELKAKDYRVEAALELIVTSRQFRDIRGRETAYDE